MTGAGAAAAGHPSPSVTYDVVVVGAGIAGLVAADRLLQDGANVLVVEAEDYPGGRARTIRYDGLYAEAGAMVFTDDETETLALLRDLGIDEFITLGAHGTELAIGGRRVGLSRMDGRISGVRDLVELGRLAAATWQRDSPMPRATPSLLWAFGRLARAVADEAAAVDYPYRPADRAEWDTIDFATFIRRFDPGLVPYLDLQLKVTAGQAADRISLFWGLVTSRWNADRFLWLAGGTSRCPEALSARLGDRLVLHAPAVSIRAGNPAEVEFLRDGAQRVVSARSVVIATTPSVARALAPGLPSWKMDALGRVPFGAYIAVHLVARKRFWSHAVSTGYLNCAGTVFADLVDATRGQDGLRGVLTAFIADPEATRVLALSDGEIVSEVLRDLGHVLPGRVSGIEETRVYRWREGIPYFPPSYATVLSRLQESCENVHFCGDYTQGAGMHDAVLSGLTAAAEVRDRLQLGGAERY